MAKVDTIVVGAGSAGGVIAARLSEDPAHRVLLLEDGPLYRKVSDLPPSLSDPWNPDLLEHTWGYEAFMVEPAASRGTTPYPRGRVVGGSSAVNGTLALRGTQSDFAGWAATGLDGWGYDDVLPSFKRLENDLQHGGDTAYHGSTGPIPITRIPKSDWPRSYHAFEAALVGRGFPEAPDLNAPGAYGVGPVPRNQAGETRASSLVAYLQPLLGRENLTIAPGSLVRSLVFEASGRRCIGVEVEKGGQVSTIYAGRVVVSAGATNSPQLLMRSGIGPADELARLGIDVRADLPGVGRNFMDHCYVPVLTSVAEEDPGLGFRTALLYSSSPAFFNDMCLVPSLLKVESINFEVPADARFLLIMPAIIGKPASKGWLSLRSADPHDEPDIHLNFLSEQVDVDRMMELVRLTFDISSTSPMREELKQIIFPAADVVADDAKLLAFMRENVGTAYHGAGTCKMGPDSDPMAVVDANLRIRGIDGLFVADASIMPDITSSMTSLSSFMIGERASELLSH